jgi:hypothetical protein
MNAFSFLHDVMTDVLKPVFTFHSQLFVISADETTLRYATKEFSSFYTYLTVRIFVAVCFILILRKKATCHWMRLTDRSNGQEESF